MNEDIVKNFNELVSAEDEVYILGDLTLGNLDDSADYLRQLNGHIHIILGNHDTNTRIEFYEYLGWDVHDALRIKWGDYSLFLCHYPTMTFNLETEYLTQTTINLYGHTHQKTNFYNDIPYCYHVGVDSHCNKPVLINDIIDEIKNEIVSCKNYL